MMNCNVAIENDTMTITVDYPDINRTDVTTVRRLGAGFEINNMDIDGPASHILRMASSWMFEGINGDESAMHGNKVMEDLHSTHNVVFDGIIAMVNDVRDLVFSNRFTGHTFVREVKKMLNDYSFDVCESAVPVRIQSRLSDAFADTAKKVGYKSAHPERDAAKALDELDVMVSDIFKMIGVSV